MHSRVKAKTRPRFGHPYAFKDDSDDASIRQSMAGFLERVWRGAPKGAFFFVATSDPDGQRWREHVIPANGTTVGLKTFLNAYSRWDFNLYFCPNPFSEERRKKAFALPTRVGWCDMDESDPWAYQPEANLLWETSPDRYQALWLWDKRHSVVEAEDCSRALTKRHGGDSSQSITKMLRIPGSVNHKPQYDEPFVRLVHQNWSRTAARPKLLPVRRRVSENAFLDLDIDPTRHDRAAVQKRYHKNLDLKARYLIGNRKVYELDRSAQIYHIIVGLHEAGASLDEIACVLWDSPYFVEKYGKNLEKLNEEITRVIGKLERAS